MIAPTPPGTPGARSAWSMMRNFSLALDPVGICLDTSRGGRDRVVFRLAAKGSTVRQPALALRLTRENAVRPLRRGSSADPNSEAWQAEECVKGGVSNRILRRCKGLCYARQPSNSPVMNTMG